MSATKQKPQEQSQSQAPRQQQQVQSRKEQEFRFTAPTAMTVQLVGDFTGWRQAPITLSKAADGTWRTRVSMQPGTHRYRFMVDGEWRDDPDCTLRVPNPYGTEDAVRTID